MSAGKEKMEAMLRKIAGNVDKIFLVTMGVILGGVGFLYYSENNAPEPEEKQPQKVDPQVVVSTSTSEPSGWPYWAVVVMASKADEIENSPYERLLRFNPFDAAAVRDAEQLIEQANSLINSARQKKEAGQLEAALQEVIRAEEMSPNPQARQLKAEIEAEIKKMEEEKAKAAAEGANTAGQPAAPAAPGPAGN